MKDGNPDLGTLREAAGAWEEAMAALARALEDLRAARKDRTDLSSRNPGENAD
jgi:hypothetical protein